MGWWQISDTTGKIDHEHKTDTGMRGGDGPADTFGGVVGTIIDMYRKTYDRNPYKYELHAALEFVIAPLGLKEKP